MHSIKPSQIVFILGCFVLQCCCRSLQWRELKITKKGFRFKRQADSIKPLFCTLYEKEKPQERKKKEIINIHQMGKVQIKR